MHTCGFICGLTACLKCKFIVMHLITRYHHVVNKLSIKKFTCCHKYSRNYHHHTHFLQIIHNLPVILNRVFSRCAIWRLNNEWAMLIEFAINFFLARWTIRVSESDFLNFNKNWNLFNNICVRIKFYYHSNPINYEQFSKQVLDEFPLQIKNLKFMIWLF